MSLTTNVSASVDFVQLVNVASGRPLGIVALVTIALSILTYGLFYKSSDWHKTAAFAMLFLGAAMLVGALLWEGKKQADDEAKSRTNQAGASQLAEGNGSSAAADETKLDPHERAALGKEIIRETPRRAPSSTPSEPKLNPRPPVRDASPKEQVPTRSQASQDASPAPPTVVTPVTQAPNLLNALNAELPTKAHLEVRSPLGNRRDGWLTISKVEPTAVGFEVSVAFKFDNPDDAEFAGAMPSATKATRAFTAAWLCNQAPLEARRPFGERITVTAEIAGRENTGDVACPAGR